MAIADPGRQVDGFNGLPMGMDSSKAPNLIDPKSYALGVNVVARGGRVKTRPGFAQLNLESDSADPEALTTFQNGRFQGACIYNQPVNRDQPSDISQGGKDKTYIVAVAGGWIFRIDPQNKKIIRLNGTPGTLLTSVAVTELTSVSNVVTATTSVPHNLSPGDKINYTGANVAAFNVANAVITDCPSVYQFRFSAAGSGTATATTVGSYTIATASQGYLALPQFMDTTFYTLGVAGATKLVNGSGFTASGKIFIEDEFPFGVTLGLTGSGFEATIEPLSGDIQYINVTSAGQGFSRFAQAQAFESMTVNLSLRFKRDSSQTTRPWPDPSHPTRRHYFAQTDKFLIIQDGIGRPFVFDGTYLRRSFVEGNPAISRGTGGGTVKAVRISKRGSGYTTPPAISFTGGGGTGAAATANLSPTGQVDSITITNAGSGYTSQPAVSFTGGGGTGARAYTALNHPTEIPTGSLMTYGQGRLFVANSNRFEIFALDLVGSHINAATGTTAGGATVYPLSDPRNSVLFNTENTYLGEGGSLLSPAFMGKIVSLQFLPTQNTTAGTGQLFAFCEFGTASFRVAAARASWGSLAEFQTILYQSIGGVGPDAFAQVNGDLFFRSADGLRSYRNAAAEFNSYGNTVMSAELDRFLKDEPVHLLYGVSCGYSSEGRFLMTALPQETKLVDENSTTNLYFKAVVSLDFNTLSSNLGKTMAAYDGIWTGLDFVHILSGDFGRRPRTYFLALSCGLLSVWELDSKSKEDRPVGGVDLALASATLAGTVSSSGFSGASVTEKQISLSTFSSFNPDSYRLELTSTNASGSWTSAGMGAQGLTLSYAFSDIDVPAAGALSNASLSSFLRSKTLTFGTQAGASVSTAVDLGPVKSSGFLYVRLQNTGTLPGSNVVSYNLDLEGESSGFVPIKAELETSSFQFQNGFEEKRLIRSDLWLSDLREQTDVEVYYRPDQYPSWLYWDEFSLLPETSIAIRPLPSDSLYKGTISSALAQDSVSIDLSRYQSRLVRGLGLRLDFTIGSVPPGTGADPYSIGISYRISDLTPVQKTALTPGTQAHTDFYGGFRSVSVPIPTTSGSRYINLYRPVGKYLYINYTYPSIFAATSYDFTSYLFGLEQGSTSPDQVLSGGFLSSLINLAPQYAPQVRLMNPVEQADPITGRLFAHGHEFQQRLVWTGNATIQKAFLHAAPLTEPVGGNSL